FGDIAHGPRSHWPAHRVVMSAGALLLFVGSLVFWYLSTRYVIDYDAGYVEIQLQSGQLRMSFLTGPLAKVRNIVEMYGTLPTSMRSNLRGKWWGRAPTYHVARAWPRRDVFWRDVTLPFWLIVPLCGLCLFAAWPRRRVYPRGRCATCGYNLTGNESGKCPEC